MNEWLTKDELLAYIDKHGFDCYDIVICADNWGNLDPCRDHRFPIRHMPRVVGYMLIKAPESKSPKPTKQA